MITDLLRRHGIGWPSVETEPGPRVPDSRVRTGLDPAEEAQRRRRLLAQEAYTQLLEAEAALLARQERAGRGEGE